jgi:hypothetical protein
LIVSGTHSGKDDAIMTKYFTPPIVVPAALVVLVVITTMVWVH